jgi:beta-xylosidase
MITYTNPVYPDYFADPFVWKHEGVYYAIGTGAHEAAGEVGDTIFPLLRSLDFAHWEAAGNALVRPPAELGHSFWAPEVTYHDGRFYLYYSVGHEDKDHQLRVAIAHNPLGPYIDSGNALIDLSTCPFAIDPDPFRDVDGQWYLFYARDFLDEDNGYRHGTAIVVDRLVDMTRLAGDERTVLRARSDWQRFMTDRPMYGGVFDWHTLEGPCVRRHGELYYCFYSGGRWETDTYGVDFGVADNVLGPYSDIGNEAGPRILRTIPGKVIGPGHNSMVKAPDDSTDYIIYHAWDREGTARRLCVDRIDWTSYGPRCDGPTWTPQPLAEP